MDCDPFDLDGAGNSEARNDDHLQSMIEVLGPMPERMLQAWGRRQYFVDDDGNLLQKCIEDSLSDPLEFQIAKYKPICMSSEEALVFEDFLMSLFKYEPEKRPSAEELLQHPWLWSWRAMGRG